MDVSKITKGNWDLMDGGFTRYRSKPNLITVYATNSDLEMICDVKRDDILHHRNQDFKANAELIAEAGTITNQCGFSPKELLEQRDELLKVLEDLLNTNFDIDSSGRYVKRFTSDEITNIHAIMYKTNK